MADRCCQRERRGQQQRHSYHNDIHSSKDSRKKEDGADSREEQRGRKAANSDLKQRENDDGGDVDLAKGKEKRWDVDGDGEGFRCQ